MTWVVPAALEAAVYASARERLGDGVFRTAALRAAIIDRAKRYTSDREHLAQPADRNADLAARAAFFTVTDAIKIAIPLAELRGRDALPTMQGRALRVVDLGAGCGAMSLGLCATLAGDLEITAIDHDADALDIAVRAVRAYAATRAPVAAATITSRVADVTRAELPSTDLVVIGTLLNELPVAARLPIVTRALHAIGDDGAVIIIEPALRDTTRALHDVRDAILAQQLATVFAPCTRRGAPCPALADPDDWCHEDRAVELPPLAAELARLTHLRDGNLKFSYLVLRRSPLPLVADPGAWRVVSSPHSEKGKLQLYGCSDAGRVLIRRLRRNRAEGNRAFEAAQRGDVLVVEHSSQSDRDVPNGERVEISADTRVTRVEPAK